LSVLAIKPEQKGQPRDWARLIPGEAQLLHQGKKGPQSVKLCVGEENVVLSTASIVQRRLRILEPRPLESRAGWRWLRSLISDWALVTLNWLLVGAVLVPLRDLFPRVRSFEYAAGAPIYLLGVAVLHAALITLIAYAEGLHNSSIDLRRQARILAKAVVWASCLLCAAYSLQGAPWTISALICVAGLLPFSILLGWRWRFGALESPDSADTRNVVIIGAGDTGQRIASEISQQSIPARRLCGFLDDTQPVGNRVVGHVADLARIARQEFIDEVILAAPPDAGLTRRVLNEARRLRLDVEIVPELFGCHPLKQEEIDPLGDLPLICLHAEHLPQTALFFKRALDVVLAGVASLVLLPLLLVIAAMIKLDSRGPVLYCAPRAGRKGRLFPCFKFRTMVNNADDLKFTLRHNNERAGPFFKISHDPRITRLGHLLRRYSLDEPPQLWNVIRGEMSLVGPRPHPLDDVAGYEIEHLARLDVKPGITGLWQVTARRDPSFHRGLELDREYIHSWSLGLDARILLKTLRAVVQGSGE
jgi:exopolysaccharide biosynthesis polyprenyl glycosylphosphotransferase